MHDEKMDLADDYFWDIVYDRIEDFGHVDKVEMLRSNSKVIVYDDLFRKNNWSIVKNRIDGKFHVFDKKKIDLFCENAYIVIDIFSLTEIKNFSEFFKENFCVDCLIGVAADLKSEMECVKNGE